MVSAVMANLALQPDKFREILNFFSLEQNANLLVYQFCSLARLDFYIKLKHV